MLTFTLQDAPTSYRCFYVESNDGWSYVAGDCGGSPGRAYIDRRTELKDRLKAGLICYYNIRDNRGRSAKAGVCEGELNKIVDDQIPASAPTASETFWDRHGTKVLVGGILTGAVVGGVAWRVSR